MIGEFGNSRRWWAAAFVVSAALVVTCVSVHLVRQNKMNRALLEAIQMGRSPSAVQELIREGADVNAAGANLYDTPLFRAAGGKSPEIVKVLLASGASVQPVGAAKMGPIFAVTSSDASNQSECRAIIQQLQGKGESIEERDVLGFTPLMRAVWSGNTVATKALLDLGADSHAVNNLGQKVRYWTDRMPPKPATLVRLLSEHDAGPHKT